MIIKSMHYKHSIIFSTKNGFVDFQKDYKIKNNVAQTS